MNCDRIARWYRWLEYGSCGRALERRRFEYLDAAADARRVLMLGEGDGRFLAAFVRRYPDASVDSVEISLQMIRLQTRRTQAGERVRIRHADAARVPDFPAGSYDLVVTHFFLDCFSTAEAAQLIGRISRAAAPRARWLISEFHQSESGFARYWTAAFIRVCYFFFRLTTGLKTNRLPEYGAALEANGFRRARHRRASGGLLVSELWERG